MNNGNERGYMMRSRRRPAPANRYAKRAGKSPVYAIVTVLLLLLLWPIGLILLWIPKLRWSWSTKLTLTILSLAVCFFMLTVFLTANFANPVLANAQTRTRTAVRKASSAIQLTVEAPENAMGDAVRSGKGVLLNLTDSVASVVQKTVPAMRETAAKTTLNLADSAQILSVLAYDGAHQVLYDMNVLPTPVPTATPEPTVEPTPVPTPTPEPVDIVFKVTGESVYHRDRTCFGIEGDLISLTITQAETEELIPCEKCALTSSSQIVSMGTQESEGFEEAPEPTEAPVAVETPEPTEEPQPTEEPTEEPVEVVVSLASVPPTPTVLPTPTVTPEPTAVPTPVPLPSVKSAESAVVYYTTNGKWYHAKYPCGKMSVATAHTLSELAASGRKLKRCTACNPPEKEYLDEESTVVWGLAGDTLYHTTDECESIQATLFPNGEGTLVLMTLDEAILEEGRTGCPLCGAYLFDEAERVGAGISEEANSED